MLKGAKNIDVSSPGHRMGGDSYLRLDVLSANSIAIAFLVSFKVNWHLFLLNCRS